MRERTYESRPVNGLREVIARTVGSEWEVRYLLDPERGWNAVRVRVTSGGKLLREARASLKKFGDVWFPEVYEIYERDYKQGKEPRYVVEVHSASFNQPDHPLRFTPEDIGIEVGTNILLYKDHSSRGERLRMGWDGGELVPLKELLVRIRAGELEKGPRFVAASERAGAMGRGVESMLRLMERYTRNFIKKYKLNEEQAQKALSILKDCRGRAETYGRSKKEEYQRIRREVSAAYDDASLSPTERAEKVDRLKQQMLRLEQPLFRIHYWELVPRLNRLPTRAQRKAAAEREFARQQKRAATEHKILDELEKEGE
jgi:polyhydroxyalkanoate synthesis regulator phasin